VEIPIAQGFYKSDSLPLSHQECINLLPVKSEVPSLSEWSLRGTPGILEIVDSGGGVSDANRGSHKKGDIPYFVNGTTLYKVNRSVVSGVEVFTLVSLGSIPGSDRVWMADNGTQLCIVVNGNGYIYNESAGTPFQQITDPNFTANGNPQNVRFIDGYFACTTDSKKWIISNLNNGLVWGALDFGSAEADPDNIVGSIVHNNQMFIIGSISTEGFQNIGGSGFPFQRNNILLDKGCSAPHTLVKSNQRYFMIGKGEDERPAIWMYQNSQYTKVSTDAIDKILGTYSDAVLEDAYAISWGYSGQYLVAFTLSDTTFVYNITTSRWVEFKSLTETSGVYSQGKWRVSSLVTAYGYQLVGDSISGKIGILDADTKQEFTTNIIRVFTTPPVYNKGNSFKVSRLELSMQAGVGNGVSNPQISMSLSKDGMTFGYELNRCMGRVGEYTRRIMWTRLGRMSNSVTFKFRVSDPVSVAIYSLQARIR
jgi:hypothetical protein